MVEAVLLEDVPPRADPAKGLTSTQLMLAELSMVEQRYLAVREVLDTGASVADVARRHGVDRHTLHRWLILYARS